MSSLYSKKFNNQVIAPGLNASNLLLTIAYKNSGSKDKSEPVTQPKYRGTIAKEVVLEMRARHEFFNWSTTKVMEHYDLTYARAYQILSYLTLGKLIAKKSDANL